MENEVIRVTNAEKWVVEFETDRLLSQRLCPAADESAESFRFSAQVMPAGVFPRLSVQDVYEHVRSLAEQPVRHAGTFPDASQRRTVSGAVVGGYPPFTSYIGASGFVRYAETPSFERSKALFPHWWHAPLVALLRWAASYYAAVDYDAQVHVELELSGIEGAALGWTQHNDPSEHGSLEPNVLVHETIGCAELARGAEDVAIRLTLAASAAFNWAPSVEQARKALAT